MERRKTMTKESTIREILKKHIPHCMDITCDCYKAIDQAEKEIKSIMKVKKEA